LLRLRASSTVCSRKIFRSAIRKDTPARRSTSRRDPIQEDRGRCGALALNDPAQQSGRVIYRGQVTDQRREGRDLPAKRPEGRSVLDAVLRLEVGEQLAHADALDGGAEARMAVFE
jgi:hypothetical protein